MTLHSMCNADAIQEPRAVEALGEPSAQWLPTVTIAATAHARPERAQGRKQVIDMRAATAHPTALAQVAERFLGRTETVEATVHVAPHELNVWRRTAGKWLVEITTQLTTCARAGIALIDTRRGDLQFLAYTGLPRSAGRHWWGRIHHALGDASWRHGGLSGLREGRVVLLGQDSRLNDERGGVGSVLVAPLLLHGQFLGVLALEDQDELFMSAHTTEVLARAMARLVIVALQDGASPIASARVRKSHHTGEGTGLQEVVLSQTSHELRAPLAALKASIQLGEKRLASLLNAEPISDAMAQGMWEVQALLERAQQYVALEDRLASDLGDLAHIDMGKLELLPMAADLASIVRDVVEGQRLAWPGRVILLDTPQAGVPVLADRDRILQAVTNYLMNALKYSPDDQPVEVQVRAETRVGRVTVRDYGIGLPVGERKRIWEPFYRSAGVKVLSGPAASLGLGLYISRSIVRRHHGKVGVRSVPGQGSTFWLTLPLRVPHSDEHIMC